MKIIKYALDIVFRRKLRTFLTSLGITISVILLSFIIFGMKGLENTLVQEFTSRFNPNEITVMKENRFSQFISPNDDTPEKQEEEVKNTIMDDDVVKQIRDYEYTEKVLQLLAYLQWICLLKVMKFHILIVVY